MYLTYRNWILIYMYKEKEIACKNNIFLCICITFKIFNFNYKLFIIYLFPFDLLFSIYKEYITFLFTKIAIFQICFNTLRYFLNSEIIRFQNIPFLHSMHLRVFGGLFASFLTPPNWKTCWLQVFALWILYALTKRLCHLLEWNVSCFSYLKNILKIREKFPKLLYEINYITTEQY